MRHVWWHIAYLFCRHTRTTISYRILSYHSKTIIPPWGQSYPLVILVPWKFGFGRVPSIWFKWGVVLDDELGDGWIVFVDKFPLDLSKTSLAISELHIYGRIWHICNNNNMLLIKSHNMLLIKLNIRCLFMSVHVLFDILSVYKYRHLSREQCMYCINNFKILFYICHNSKKFSIYHFFIAIL